MRLGARLGWGGFLAVVVCACAKGASSTGDLGEDDGGVVTEGGITVPTDGGKKDASTPTDSGGSCSGHVVLNEVQTDGTSATDEFVELYNPTGCKVTLGGWKLQYRSSGNSAPSLLYTFTASESIEANSFLLIGNGKIKPGMAKSDGQVGLVDDGDTTIDGLGYGSVSNGSFTEGSTAPSPTGSVGRKSDGVDTDNNAQDWKAFSTATPGASNQ